VQHLNLYGQLEKPKEPVFSARQQLRLISALCIVMLMAYGWLMVGQQTINRELSGQQQQQRVVDEKLSELRAEKGRRLKDNQLEKDIESLKRQVGFRRQLLASVDPDANSPSNGFAEHLEGLARQHLEGMWFTDIELHQGGQQLALLGKTRTPEYVPRFIQRLSKEPIFAGHQFRIFRLYSSENENTTLNFELRSRAQGEELKAADELTVNTSVIK
jgi:hypothetical protein